MPGVSQQRHDHEGKYDADICGKVYLGGLFQAVRTFLWQSFTHAAPQTFSGTYLPSRPAGRTSSMMMSTANTMEFASCVDI